MKKYLCFFFLWYRKIRGKYRTVLEIEAQKKNLGRQTAKDFHGLQNGGVDNFVKRAHFFRDQNLKSQQKNELRQGFSLLLI